LSDANFRKYRVTISCSDQESPGFAAITTSDPDRVWPGSLVTVTLLPHLGAEEPLELDMMVVSPWRESLDEWAHMNSWQLELEQV
jgi:hypothetical protein